MTQINSHSFQPRSWEEGRRLRAWELKQQGWSQKKIAEALGVCQSAVSQWIKRVREGGIAALRTRPRSGRPPKLTRKQRDRLPVLLARGAEAYGYRGEVWTTPRVAGMIRQVFGVSYHPAHVSRLLNQIGWTPQKPQRRATQRDEEAIQGWKRERWPQLEKKPSGKDERSCG